jgi:pantothenate kinase-related protein Tda10
MNKIDTPMQEDLQINLDNTGNNKIQFKNENNKFIEMNKEVINLQEIMETYQRLQNMSISTENFNKQEYSRVKYQLEQEIISKIQALNTNKHLKNFIDQSQL